MADEYKECSLVEKYKEAAKKNRRPKTLKDLIRDHNRRLKRYSITLLPTPCGCITPFIDPNFNFIKIVERLGEENITHNGEVFNVSSLAKIYEVTLAINVKKFFRGSLAQLYANTHAYSTSLHSTLQSGN